LPDALDPAVLALLGERIAAHAGLRVPSWVLDSRVRARMAALGVERAGDYVERVSEGGELDMLVELLRVGETRFFRHTGAMTALADTVVPALRDSGRGKVRAWSAGCASGEEPYTLAILLRDGLPSGVEVEVIATDISEAALEVARAAEYPADALSQVPSAMRRAFEIDGPRCRVGAAYRQLVTFERRNLAVAEARFPRMLDLVLCRNVLIYFDEASRRRTVERLIESLVPGGFLFLGYSETLRDFGRLAPVRTPGAVVYRKGSGSGAGAGSGSGAGSG
jgi:chemotaxis protein methyltransferase CheR